MPGEKKDQERDGKHLSSLSRRDFVTLSMAAALAAAGGSAMGKDLPVMENEVDVNS